MKMIAAALGALLFSTSSFADDGYAYVGAVEDQEYFVLTDKAKGTAPRVNKHGIVWAEVVGINAETRNGHLKGGAVRWTFGIDCGAQELIHVVVWTKRSTAAEIVWVDDSLVAKRLKEVEFAPIKPNSVGAAVSDFACDYVKQPAEPSGAPKESPAPKSKGVFVPL